MDPSVNNSFGGNEKVMISSGDSAYPTMERKGESRRWIIVTVLVILILAVIGCFVVIINSNNFDGRASLSQSEDTKVLDNYDKYAENDKKLIEIYTGEGTEAALQYYNQNIACNVGVVSESLRPICELEMEYYEAMINEYINYEKAGCVIGGFYDEQCALKYYGTTKYIELFENGNMPENILNELNSDANRKIIEEFRVRGEIEMEVAFDA